MSSQLFLSYAAPDREFARCLSGDLRSAGFSVWRDEDAIESGAEWSSSVLEALLRASALIVVGSRAAADSAFVRKELRAFTERRTGPIIPVMLEPVEPTRTLMRLVASYSLIDFQSSYDRGFQALVRALPADARLEQVTESPALRRASKGYAFINYAEEDLDFVAGLTVFMGERGYAYWDYEKSDRNSHTQLYLELEEAITRAKAVLCVLSPAWRSSIWAVKEYLYAGEVGTPTFLLRAKGIPPTLVIAGAHFIDFVSDSSKGYARLEQELERKNL